MLKRFILSALLTVGAGDAHAAAGDTRTNPTSGKPQVELASGAHTDAWTVYVADEAAAAVINTIQSKQKLVIGNGRVFDQICSVAAPWVAPNGGVCFLETQGSSGLDDWQAAFAYAVGDEFTAFDPVDLAVHIYQVPVGFVGSSGATFDAVEEARYDDLGDVPASGTNVTQLTGGAAHLFSTVTVDEDRLYLIENTDAALASNLNAIATGDLYLNGVVDADDIVPLDALNAFTYYRDGNDIYLQSGGDAALAQFGNLTTAAVTRAITDADTGEFIHASTFDTDFQFDSTTFNIGSRVYIRTNNTGSTISTTGFLLRNLAPKDGSAPSNVASPIAMEAGQTYEVRRATATFLNIIEREAVGAACAYDDCVEVDASAAAFTNVLPVSSGSGYTRLFNLVDLTNGATFDRDAGGDTVNLSTGTGPWLTADNTAGSTAHKGQQILCTDIETTAGNDAWDCEALTGDPITTVSMNLQRLGALAAPSAGLDAINRDYFEANDSVTTRYINSSLAATDELLLGATGSNPARLYTLVDKTNAATLSVLPGQSLNGVVDATFNFDAYGVGTQFLVTDRAVGLWDVSVIGESQQKTLTTLEAINSSTVNITSAAAYTDIAGNEITLTPGKWLLSYDTDSLFQAASQGVNQNAAVRVFDVTDNAAIAESERSLASFYNNNDGQLRILRNSASWSGVLNVTADKTVKLQATEGGAQPATLSIPANRSKIMAVQLPATESVLAGMVTPEALHTITMVPTGEYSSDVPLINTNQYQLSAALLTTFNDPHGMLIGDTLVVSQDGDYKFDVNFNGSTGITARFWIEVDGVKYVDTVGSDTRSGSSSISTVLSLTTANVVTLHGINVADSINFTLQQLPTSTVVMPDALEVTDLHRFTLAKTTGQTTATTTYPAQERLTWQVAPVDTAGGEGLHQYIVQAGGEGTWKFKVSAETDAAGTMDGNSTIQITVNGVEVSRSGFATAGDNVGGGGSNDVNYGQTDVEVENLVAGDVIEAHVSMVQGIAIAATQTTTYFQGRQVSTKTVINTTDVAVTDQAASGYMDVGTMRIQWGTLVQASDVQVITLPASFLDGSYSLVGSADGGNRFGNVAFSAKTTTTFVIANEAAALGGAISWQAIGLRP